MSLHRLPDKKIVEKYLNKSVVDVIVYKSLDLGMIAVMPAIPVSKHVEECLTYRTCGGFGIGSSSPLRGAVLASPEDCEEIMADMEFLSIMSPRLNQSADTHFLDVVRESRIKKYYKGK